MAQDVTPVGAGVGIANAFSQAVTGVTGAVVTNSGTNTTDLGTQQNYVITVYVPIPFANLNLNVNLVGAFVLPALSKLGIPKAMLNFGLTIRSLLNRINQDIIDLMKAIPEATVSIIIKVGPAIIANFVFVAEKEPVIVAPPSFQLALPNLAVDTSFAISIPFPSPPPVVIKIPIPVPQVALPLVLTGGNVSVAASSTVVPGPPGVSGGAAVVTTPPAANVSPFVVATPIQLPRI